MRRKLYKWIWNRLYYKVVQIEQNYYRSGKSATVKDCIRLENLLNYFKDNIIN